MTYGAYSFSPVPLLTINKQYQKNESQEIVGVVNQVTLNGFLVEVDAGGIDLIDVSQDSLKSAFATDCQRFRIQCGANTLIDAYPRINSISFNETSNNWVYTTAFTIDMEWDEEPPGSGEDSGLHPPFIESSNETWSIEFADEKSPFSWTPNGTADACPYQIRVTHQIGAKGKRHCGPGGLDKEAWQQAQLWVVPRLGFDDTKLAGSGTLNLDVTSLAPFNHMRTNEVDVQGGIYDVTESWLVINPSGTGIAGNAVENFTINVQTGIETGRTTVGIEGSIQGLESRSYGTNPGDFNISEYKYTAASGYWATVKNRLYDRVREIGHVDATRPINITPISTSVGHNICDGVINYTYSYDDRKSTCISGALSEVITINDNNPTDVFAAITVLGNCQGPVLQDMGTQTVRTRELSIEIVVEPASVCPTSSSNVTTLLASSPKSDVDVVVDAFSTQLSGIWESVFITQDSESWDAFGGRYTRNVGWTYG